MNETKRKLSLRGRLIILEIASFIVSITPLVLIFTINWNKYAATPADTVRLSLGGILIVMLFFLKAIGKLRIPSRIVFFGMIFVMSYLLKAVLADILLISGMALAGEIVDCICFQRAIRITRDNIFVNKTADATTQKVEEVFKKYVSNGRV